MVTTTKLLRGTDLTDSIRRIRSSRTVDAVDTIRISIQVTEVISIK
jgi:hypothetical protein